MPTYSIRYGSDETDSRYSEWALDWSWNVEGKWARSGRDGDGCPWTTVAIVNRYAFEKLLEHFGLLAWIDLLSFETILVTPPKELAKLRRGKESELHLPALAMISNTLGYHVHAEQHEEL